MTIKAIIFDLDDTLYDCSNTLSKAARERAIEALLNQGLCATKADVHAYMQQPTVASERKISFVERLVEQFGPRQSALIEVGLKAYHHPSIDVPIACFAETMPLLNELREQYKLILVTTGVRARQQEKIRLLGLTDMFDCVLIDDISENLSKRERFQAAMANFALQASEVVAIGDRVFSEIKIGNQLGMTTIQLRQGAYQQVAPTKEWEAPDYAIRNLSEVTALLQRINADKPTKVVVLGGGTGLPTVLSGLSQHNTSLTGIVAITDAGRSSGKLRQQYDMPPPGDIRNCLAALATGDKGLIDLLQYRFERGELLGHTIGNLLLVALTEMVGSFEQAVTALAQLLKIKGRIYPSGVGTHHIQALCADGTRLHNENDIVASDNPNVHCRSRIVSVSLDKPAQAPAAALSALRAADVIVLGPGGLYTSVISNCLADGMVEAIQQSNATVIYVCNVVTQACQTASYSASEHVRALNAVLGAGVIQHVIVHSERLNAQTLSDLALIHSEPVLVDDTELAQQGLTVHRCDVLTDNEKNKEVLWQKQQLLQHDPNKLGKAIMTIVATVRQCATI